MTEEPVAEQVVLGLGSNLGDREGHLQAARTRLRRATGLEIVTVSPLYESPPLEALTPQGSYLNQVLVVSTRLAPRRLLDLCLATEAQSGRPGDHAHGLPRTIDIDIITYASLVLDHPDLVVPHPRYTQRRFVLLPLQSVLPDFTDPVTGYTIQRLVEGCPDASAVNIWPSLAEAPC